MHQREKDPSCPVFRAGQWRFRFFRPDASSNLKCHLYEASSSARCPHAGSTRVFGQLEARKGRRGVVATSNSTGLERVHAGHLECGQCICTWKEVLNTSACANQSDANRTPEWTRHCVVSDVSCANVLSCWVASGIGQDEKFGETSMQGRSTRG